MIWLKKEQMKMQLHDLMMANDISKHKKPAAEQLVKVPDDAVKEKINNSTIAEPNDC